MLKNGREFIEEKFDEDLVLQSLQNACLYFPYRPFKFDQFIFCVTVMPFTDVVKEQAILISVQPRVDTGLSVAETKLPWASCKSRSGC